MSGPIYLRATFYAVTADGRVVAFESGAPLPEGWQHIYADRELAEKRAAELRR